VKIISLICLFALHGVNPRTIMGQTWWDKKRKETYERYDFHCIACGVHKSEAKKHKWLEAHEFWKIDYNRGTCEISSIEPLCHYCHNFIHSGRLENIMDKHKSVEEVKDILEHGLSILSYFKLKCFPGTLSLAKRLGCHTYYVEPYDLPKKKIRWSTWRLLFEGKEYRSNFKNEDEWFVFYKSK